MPGTMYPQSKHKYLLRTPRGLLFFMVFVPWMPMAITWTPWEAWAIITIGMGQLVALLTLMGSDDYKHAKYMKNR